MKLSKDTLALLKNFASINPNILIETGSIIKTMSPQRNMLAQAVVSDEFPNTFGIYDLSKFLSVLSLFKEADLDFAESDNYVVIRGANGSKLRYMFADPSVLIVPDKKVKFPVPEVNVTLTREQIEEVIKAATTIGVQDVCFVGDEGNINLVAKSVETGDSTDEYSITVAQTDRKFSVEFKLETLKVLPAAYNVEFANNEGGRIVTRWTHTETELVYWIAPSLTSVF